jgi:hypothetical protein
MVDRLEMTGIRFAWTRNGDTGWTRAMPGTLADQKARLRSVRESRQKITPAFLERVASTYRNADAPKLSAVADAFECSERSAARYVATARKAGLLDG